MTRFDRRLSTTMAIYRTQEGGGSESTSVSGVTINVTHDQVQVRKLDVASAATQPVVVTVDSTTTDQASASTTAVRASGRRGIADAASR